MSDEQSQQKEGTYRTPFTVDLFDMQDPMQIEIHLRHLRSTNSSPSIYKILTDFSSADWVEDNLKTNFSLNPTQIKNILRVIRDILLGDLYLGDMVNEIEKKLSISPEQAKQIANKIVGELFASALDDIKILQLQKFKDQTRGAGPVQRRADPIIASQYQQQRTAPAQQPRPAQQMPPQPRSQVQPPRPVQQVSAQPRPTQTPAQPQTVSRSPLQTNTPQPNQPVQQTQMSRTTPSTLPKPIDLGYPNQKQNEPKPGDKGVVSNPANVLDLRDMEEKT